MNEASGSMPSVLVTKSPSRSFLISKGPKSSLGSVNRVSRYSKVCPSINFESSRTVALFAVPGGPRINRFSLATRHIPIRSIISSLPTKVSFKCANTALSLSMVKRMFDWISFMSFVLRQGSGSVWARVFPDACPARFLKAFVPESP
ncbi:hypothetical protein D3C85_946990 [compost metagenome]